MALRVVSTSMTFSATIFSISVTSKGMIMRSAQGPSVFAYRFDWDEEPTLLGSDLGVVIGASHGMEIAFVVVLAGVMIYADRNAAQTYQAYEAGLETGQGISGQVAAGQSPEGQPAAEFDQRVGVYAFQWGFLFFDENGAASRNAVKVAPGAKVLFTIAANDVIHGFNIPVARVTTELEPGRIQSIWIRAPEKPGKYLIQCLNYCGLGHTQMKAWLVVENDG